MMDPIVTVCWDHDCLDHEYRSKECRHEVCTQVPLRLKDVPEWAVVVHQLRGYNGSMVGLTSK